MGSCKRSMVRKGSRRRAAGQVSDHAHGDEEFAGDLDGPLVELNGGPSAGKHHSVVGTPVVIVLTETDAAGAAGRGGSRSKVFYIRRDDGHHEHRPDAGKILAAIARTARAAADDD